MPRDPSGSPVVRRDQIEKCRFDLQAQPAKDTVGNPQLIGSTLLLTTQVPQEGTQTGMVWRVIVANEENCLHLSGRLGAGSGVRHAERGVEAEGREETVAGLGSEHIVEGPGERVVAVHGRGQLGRALGDLTLHPRFLLLLPLFPGVRAATGGQRRSGKQNHSRSQNQIALHGVPPPPVEPTLSKPRATCRVPGTGKKSQSLQRHATVSRPHWHRVAQMPASRDGAAAPE